MWHNLYSHYYKRLLHGFLFASHGQKRKASQIFLNWDGVTDKRAASVLLNRPSSWHWSWRRLRRWCRHCSPYDPNLPLFLCCNASYSSRFGLILTQKTETGYIAIKASSTDIKDPQKNYSVHELELLGLSFAAQKCVLYLNGNRFCTTLCTDHRTFNDLEKIELNKINHSRVLRQLKDMLAFNFRVLSIPGSSNWVANFLLRLNNPDKCATVYPRYIPLYIYKEQGEDSPDDLGWCGGLWGVGAHLQLLLPQHVAYIGAALLLEATDGEPGLQTKGYTILPSTSCCSWCWGSIPIP